MAGIDVHMIEGYGGAIGSRERIYCTCGNIASAGTIYEAERLHNVHIVEAIRANRAADKTGA